MLAWILRFIKNHRLKEKCKETELTYEEVQSAENCLLKLIQKESFARSKMKALKNMKTFKDDSDVLKVRTKLILGDEEENFKCPILLPDNHEVIRRLIHQKHCELQYAGLRALISNLRENYWIISVNKIAKRQKDKDTNTQLPATPVVSDQDSSEYDDYITKVAPDVVTKAGRRIKIPVDSMYNFCCNFRYSIKLQGGRLCKRHTSCNPTPLQCH
ncbi:hypothetical protein HNY73_003155 [Argiope bruennichi]|uniref:Uncharacterized protein n=1 Tax=Argiope bruennichi TaxID=94029 RepID=A0A8T0FVZ5_ARGBR|nr:hypothetical protein HNY73_003155 [Argiope bruennichi]